MKTLFEFQTDCKRSTCNRHAFQSVNCKLSKKQERCYYAWIKTQQKKSDKLQKKIDDIKEKFQKFLNGEIDLEFEVDDKYEDFRKQVWLRDCGIFDGISKKKDWKKYCRIWNILTDEEKKYFDEHYSETAWINENLDVCHIEERSSHPELKYVSDNTTICGRFFHSRLDSYVNPVYNINITKEERKEWFENAKRGERK
jgi:hypothetical protein